MIPHKQHQHPDIETDEDMQLRSRRTVLRRSALGIAGVGLASLLAACGGDEEEDAGVVEDEEAAEEEEGD